MFIRQIRAITSLWSVGLRQISCSLKSNRLAAHPMFILNTNITNISNDVDSIRVIRQRRWRYLSVFIRQIRAITSLWSVGLRQISCSLKSNRLAAHPMFILNTNITNIPNDADSHSSNTATPLALSLSSHSSNSCNSCSLKTSRFAAHPMFILNTNTTNISNDVDSIRVIRQHHRCYLSVAIRQIRAIRVRKNAHVICLV